MAFWGVEVKSGKPCIHRHDNVQGRLHLSQATLGNVSSTMKSLVQCNVGDKKPIYLCSLFPERLETCPLNLDFEEQEDVTFSVIGPHSIHLSGFYYGESQNEHGDGYDLDSYGEDIAETESETDDSTDYDSEDEYDDFIDEPDTYSDSPVPNSGVKIEEIIDDERPTNENVESKWPKKKNKQLSAFDANDNSQKQIFLKSGNSVPVVESEDQDGFPISSPAKDGSNARNTEEKAEGKDTGADKEDKLKMPTEEPGHVRSSKRKVEATAGDSEQAGKKKDKKKKVRDKEQKAHESGDSNGGDMQIEDIHNVPSGEKEKDQLMIKEKKHAVLADSGPDENIMEEKKAKKNKKEKKRNKKQGGVADANGKQTVAVDKISKKEIGEEAVAKPVHSRSFPNGLVIEELEMGQPGGKKAFPGKRVSVHYIGKLQKSGKIFDSNIGRAPFKFRLGVGQVIKGWDIGVKGMRVGDKRRLAIPPAMAYGAQGCPPTIPQNSWLVFDVELVDVN